MKKRISNLKLGIIKVYNTPTLPAHIENINNNIFVRIFRVLGGVCLLLTISKKMFLFHYSLIYIAIFINILFLIYQFVLIIYRIKHIYNILKTDKMDIKNSPIDNVATILTRGLLCMKGACEGGIFLGTILSTGIAYDWALESAGKEKVFGPLVGKFVDTISANGNKLTTEQKQQMEELKALEKASREKIEYLRKLNNLSESHREAQEILENIKSQNGVLSEQEKEDLLKAFKEEKNNIIAKSNNIKQKLNMDELLKAFKNGKK